MLQRSLGGLLLLKHHLRQGGHDVFEHPATVRDQADAERAVCVSDDAKALLPVG